MFPSGANDVHEFICNSLAGKALCSIKSEARCSLALLFHFRCLGSVLGSLAFLLTAFLVLHQVIVAFLQVIGMLLFGWPCLFFWVQGTIHLGFWVLKFYSYSCF
jgi:hypothetical protein